MWKAFFINSFIFLLTFSFASVMSHDLVFANNYDLTTFSGRETASIEKPVSPYKTKKCKEITHTDGGILTFCIADFEGTTGGFYDWGKNLMVVGSFDQYVLMHEITHATILHNYQKGHTDVTSKETQEKMAYNAENLLLQINNFNENFEKGEDISSEKKKKLGIATE